MQVYQFYIVFPPSFQSVIEKELQFLKINTKELIWNTGGVSITTELTTGFSLNHHLRSATKILLRLDEFKARDFPKLFKKASQTPWRKWLWNQDIECHITSHQSRLIHTGKIKETLQKSIAHSFKAAPPKKKTQDFFEFSPQVYVRVESDRVQMSIDTSYPPLYHRGLNKTAHPASLRENLAYACLSTLLEHIDTTKEISLIDPLCGSGTFLTEALEQEKHRAYSYQGFPCFQYEPKISISKTQRQMIFKQLYGFDLSPKIIEHNSSFHQEKNIHWETKDLLSDHQDNKVFHPNIVITNPPYNKRLKTQLRVHQILNRIIKLYSPLCIGMIIPNDQLSLLQDSPAEYQIRKKIAFRNGGFPCSFIVWQRSR